MNERADGAITIDPPPRPLVMRRRVKTPGFMQIESLECGAAALGSVLAHHGRWVSLEELRAACGVSRDGSRAANILKAARRYGLEAKGLRLDVDQLGELQLPVIAHWNFNHFVVIDGFDSSGVDLQDPAYGYRHVSWQEFDSSFTGVVLSFEPGERFTRGGSRPSAVAGLRARLSDGRPALVLCIIAGLGLLVPGLAIPTAVRIFVDQYLVAGDRSWLPDVIAITAIAAVMQVAFTWLQQIVLLRLSLKLSLSMSTRFFEHVLRLPTAFFTQRTAGHVVNRIKANDQIANLLSSQLSATILSLLTAILYLVLMFAYDWTLTLVVIVIAAGNVMAGLLGRRAQLQANRRVVQEYGTVISTTVAGVANIEAIKSTSSEASFFSRWTGQHAKLVSSEQDLALVASVSAAAPIMIYSLASTAVIALGAWQVIEGSMTVGTLTAFQMLVGGFIAPLGALVAFTQIVRHAAASLVTIDDVLNHPADAQYEGAGASRGDEDPSDVRPARRTAPRRLAGSIELRDVTFGYSRLEPPLIRGFSVRLEPGQRVAIVGPTASGKSTVSKMVAGLQQPWSGDILIGGQDRRTIPREVLAASLSFVDQDVHLFEATIRENLTLWDPTIDDDAVVRAATDAVIHDDIVKRPGGYERATLEAGADWSGGQRQRLEIARALATDPSILILDEATSALDALVEVEIDQRLRARGCTCLIVAHRLSTIRDCDEIVVLDRGVVVERGRHEDLVDLGGHYARLVQE